MQQCQQIECCVCCMAASCMNDPDQIMPSCHVWVTQTAGRQTAKQLLYTEDRLHSARILRAMQQAQAAEQRPQAAEQQFFGSLRPSDPAHSCCFQALPWAHPSKQSFERALSHLKVSSPLPAENQLLRVLLQAHPHA